MKTTVQGVIINLSNDQRSFLDDLMSRYCAAVRWSFKRLLNGIKAQEIRKAVQAKFSLNSRQANDAVFDAQTTILSQKELVELNCQTAGKRIAFTKQRIMKARSPRKIAGLKKRLEKEERKLSRWQKHREAGTIPKVVFGGKKLFQERCKKNITRQEWQEARSNRYLSRGDKTKGGNLNTRLSVCGDTVYLHIAAEPSEQNPSRYNRMTVPIYLAQKLSKKTGKVNGIPYREILTNYLKTGLAYQVEIIRKNARYYVHVTIEEETPKPYAAHGGVIGIDTNPNVLGISFSDYLGNYKGSHSMPQGEWLSARSNRKDNLVGETAKGIVKLAKQKECLLAVEHLDFKQDKSVAAKFNRISHGFVWSKFLRTLERQAKRAGVPLAKVKPPFTSIIGVLKYQHQYGISNHQAAGYVTARRALGLENEKVPKFLLKVIPDKEAYWKLSNWKQWSVIKRSVLKTSVNKEVKSLVSWQHNRKEALGLG